MVIIVWDFIVLYLIKQKKSIQDKKVSILPSFGFCR